MPRATVRIALDGHAVDLWRPTALERFVDVRSLLQDDAPAEPPYWMHLWPGALAAARRVLHADVVRPAARVIELGCGLGLPALIAAQRGAAVLATDRQQLPLAFLRHSAALNRCGLALAQMDWSAPAVRGGFHVCVGADIGYDAAAEPSVAAAIADLVVPGGVVWLADSVNTARDTMPGRLTAAGFSVTVDSVMEEEDGRAVWVRLISARRQA